MFALVALRITSILHRPSYKSYTNHTPNLIHLKFKKYPHFVLVRMDNQDINKLSDAFDSMTVSGSKKKEYKKELKPGTGAVKKRKPATQPQVSLEDRLLKDINNLKLPPHCFVEFENPGYLSAFKLVICPDRGYFINGRYVFGFQVGDDYPLQPPKVICETKIYNPRMYHPKIDKGGNVDIKILGEGWTTASTISNIFHDLQELFILL